MGEYSCSPLPSEIIPVKFPDQDGRARVWAKSSTCQGRGGRQSGCAWRPPRIRRCRSFRCLLGHVRRCAGFGKEVIEQAVCAESYAVPQAPGPWPAPGLRPRCRPGTPPSPRHARTVGRTTTPYVASPPLSMSGRTAR
jgi:hypothetical protein